MSDILPLNTASKIPAHLSRRLFQAQTPCHTATPHLPQRAS